jgi:hypothetical protein
MSLQFLEQTMQALKRKIPLTEMFLIEIRLEFGVLFKGQGKEKANGSDSNQLSPTQAAFKQNFRPIFDSTEAGSDSGISIPDADMAASPDYTTAQSFSLIPDGRGHSSPVSPAETVIEHVPPSAQAPSHTRQQTAEIPAPSHLDAEVLSHLGGGGTYFGQDGRFYDPETGPENFAGAGLLPFMPFMSNTRFPAPIRYNSPTSFAEAQTSESSRLSQVGAEVDIWEALQAQQAAAIPSDLEEQHINVFGSFGIRSLGENGTGHGNGAEGIS